MSEKNYSEECLISVGGIVTPFDLSLLVYNPYVHIKTEILPRCGFIDFIWGYSRS